MAVWADAPPTWKKSWLESFQKGSRWSRNSSKSILLVTGVFFFQEITKAVKSKTCPNHQIEEVCGFLNVTGHWDQTLGVGTLWKMCQSQEVLSDWPQYVALHICTAVLIVLVELGPVFLCMSFTSYHWQGNCNETTVPHFMNCIERPANRVRFPSLSSHFVKLGLVSTCL